MTPTVRTLLTTKRDALNSSLKTLRNEHGAAVQLVRDLEARIADGMKAIEDINKDLKTK